MKVWMRQSWWRWRNTNRLRMPFGGRTYGIHSEPVLSIDIPCLVLGPLCIHSLGHSTNVSPACSHTFYPWVGKIPWREKWIFARRIPWTEEPKGLQSMGRKESDTAEATEHAPRFGVHSLIDGHLAIWSCYEWNCQKGWRTSLCVNMVFISLG